MRPLLAIVGIILLLLGVGFALQGAGVLPTTVMNGPPWIAIGSVVAIVGLAVAFLGLRRSPPPTQGT